MRAPPAALLVAGLTCFLCPRGVVADFFAAVDDFFGGDVAFFFEDDFAAAVLDVLFVFVAGADWVVAAPIAS